MAQETEIERLVVRLMGDGKSYQKMLTTAAKDAQVAAKHVEGASHRIEGLGRSITSWAMTAGKGLAKIAAAGGAILGIGGGFAAAGFGIKLAADLEQAEIAFTVLLGSGEKAKALLNDLEKFAAATPFEMPELNNAARNLAAFGLENTKILPTLRALGDVASGIQQPIGEIAEIYGKAKVQGRLFMEDINQLTGRGIPIIGELAKQFGVAESEVRELVSSGSIHFTHLEKAFQSLSGEGGKFEGMMQKQSESLSGLFSTLKDNVGQTLKDFGEVLIERMNLKGTMKNVISFLDGFRQNFKANLNELLDWAGRQWDAFSGFVSTIWTFMGNTIAGVWDFIKKIGNTVLGGIGLDIGSFVSKALGFFSNFQENMGLLFSWFGRNWKLVLADGLNLAIAFAKNLPHNIAVGLTMIWKNFKQLFTMDFVRFIVTGIKFAAKAFINFASFAWNKLKSIFTGDEGPTFEDFLKQLREESKEVDLNFVDSIRENMKEAAKEFKNPIDGFVAQAEALPEFNLKVGQLDLPKFILDQAKDAGAGAGAAVSGELGGAVQAVTKDVKALKGTFDAVASGSADAFARVAEQREMLLERGVRAGAAPTPATAGSALRAMQSSVGTATAGADRDNGRLERIARNIEAIKQMLETLDIKALGLTG